MKECPDCAGRRRNPGAGRDETALEARGGADGRSRVPRGWSPRLAVHVNRSSWIVIAELLKLYTTVIV